MADRFLPAGQKQSRAKVPADERQGAETVESGGQWQIVGKIADVDTREATLREQGAVAFRIPDRDMAFYPFKDSPFPEALDEVLPVRRMQEQRCSRFQSVVDGPEDAHELVVVDVLREVQREGGVELIRVLCTECHDVGALE